MTDMLWAEADCAGPVTHYWAECADSVWVEVHGPLGIVWERHCTPVEIGACWEEVTCQEMADRMNP